MSRDTPITRQVCDTLRNTSLIVRNLFDEQGYDYLSSSDYGALFGDPRWRYVRTLQRPLTVGLSFTKKW